MKYMFYVYALCNLLNYWTLIKLSYRKDRFRNIFLVQMCQYNLTTVHIKYSSKYLHSFFVVTCISEYYSWACPQSQNCSSGIFSLILIPLDYVSQYSMKLLHHFGKSLQNVIKGVGSNHTMNRIKAGGSALIF